MKEIEALIMMTCRELTDFLADYRSGELDPATRERFEDHLRLCEDCVAYVRSYEDTIRLARRAYAEPNAPAVEEAPEELIEAILSSRRKRRDGWRRRGDS
jgi:anti-sigma factor RsiW